MLEFKISEKKINRAAQTKHIVSALPLGMFMSLIIPVWLSGNIHNVGFMLPILLVLALLFFYFQWGYAKHIKYLKAMRLRLKDEALELSYGREQETYLFFTMTWKI